jgi:hypothetical protein
MWKFASCTSRSQAGRTDTPDDLAVFISHLPITSPMEKPQVAPKHERVHLLDDVKARSQNLVPLGSLVDGVTWQLCLQL